MFKSRLTKSIIVWNLNEEESFRHRNSIRNRFSLVSKRTNLRLARTSSYPNRWWKANSIAKRIAVSRRHRHHLTVESLRLVDRGRSLWSASVLRPHRSVTVGSRWRLSSNSPLIDFDLLRKIWFDGEDFSHHWEESLVWRFPWRNISDRVHCPNAGVPNHDEADFPVFHARRFLVSTKLKFSKEREERWSGRMA